MVLPCTWCWFKVKAIVLLLQLGRLNADMLAVQRASYVDFQVVRMSSAVWDHSRHRHVHHAGRPKEHSLFNSRIYPPLRKLDPFLPIHHPLRIDFPPFNQTRRPHRLIREIPKELPPHPVLLIHYSLRTRMRRSKVFTLVRPGPAFCRGVPSSGKQVIVEGDLG